MSPREVRTEPGRISAGGTFAPALVILVLGLV